MVTAAPPEMGADKGVRGVVFLGLSLHSIFPSREALLASLVLASITSSITFAALQERVLYVPGFKYTGWMAQLTSLTYASCALAERLWTRDQARLATMQEYVKLSALTMGGMYLTNWSLRYLSYPLRVVFKSSKVLPVMLLSATYLGKRYTLVQYSSALLLCLGLVLFTLGDAKGRANFDIRGLLLIAVGSFFEALAATFEERRLFNQLGCTATEVVLYSNLLGFFWACLADLCRGDVERALSHSRSHPESVGYIVLAAVAGYVAQNAVLTLIKHFSAMTAELAKSCRKVITIFVSFVVFGKPWTLLHIAGGLSFSAAVAVERFAAGGSSRRFASVYMGVAALVALFLASGAGPPIYSVVIDAGSTGTRVHVFRFEGWTSQLLDVRGGIGQIYLDRKPGLGTLAHNLSSIRPLLVPLVEAAVSIVPVAQRVSTPLALRGTAGLRLLPPPEAKQILDEARQVIEAWNFKDGGIQVMDGAVEGVNLWRSVNYLLGTFRPGMHAIREPMAVVDLRGGSVQVVYLLEETVAKAAERTDHLRDFVRKVALPLGTGYAHLYQHSYLGFGLMAARAKILGLSSFSERQPCLPTGARAVWSYGGQTIEGRGLSHPTVCASLVRRVLSIEASCGNLTLETGGRCSFAGAWGGPGVFHLSSQRLLLTAYFFDRLRDGNHTLNSGAKQLHVTLQMFELAAEHACSLGNAGLSDVTAAHPDLTTESAMWLCFDLTYMAVMVKDGLGVEPERPIMVANEISSGSFDFMVSWALGVSIEGLLK